MRPGRRVTVIGAGVAGLVAAVELERSGYRVTVLEADQRIGGRILTHRFGTDPGAPTVELGAMRIPAHHHRTLAWIERLRLGDRLTAFSPLLSEPNAYVATGGGPVRIGEATAPLRADLRARLGARADHYREGTLAFGAWFTAVVGASAPPELREALATDLRCQLLGLVDRIDPVPQDPDGRIDLHALFAGHPGIRAGCSARLNSFLDDILLETSSGLHRLAGGMDQLPRRLARTVHGPIRCGHRVERIDVRAGEVLLHVRRGRLGYLLPSDFAVCTAPFPAVRRMRLTGVDADKLAVLREVVYCPATKVALHCREPFWQRTGISGGASFTAGRLRQTYYPPADGDPGRGAALLASYTIGAEADGLGLLPPRLRHRQVVRELAEFHPELLRPGMVLGSASAAWGQSPLSGGCATRWGLDPAHAEHQLRRAARPVHRLFFAGEHCSGTPAWIEGAIESAQRAAAEITAFRAPRTPVRAAG
ncbi:flavin monoamine oxidase family protein [Kitasatospora viridis]|uniref:Monoamine oxidase n=1 Tax=Kitasatospora viridis TaxID=281105 RepID=A0A561SF81_9ACTN|nr:NAD(P)/FAD-dependent oxidoreductase [Kitasatospora viridis]TWF73467.1 monoamine oxidase [Kitasatospora viridis]